MRRMRWLFFILLLSLPGTPVKGQTPSRARISEETRTISTYPFSEPNPVPILTRDPRLYPYHSFEGYSVVSEPREWKVVTLENDYIQVFVLPEVGGKIWGAVVKETGHEFIYRNEVLKFRNIALRGPWTSGGIELNFGVIGHTPATATPVDYTLKENPDGSVSCWVGAMDLPSRTHWRVEIRLPADEAVFETNVLWYNPTPLEQPYYNWMTAAAFARNDLEMTMPGNAYLEHSGHARPWPVDSLGRYLPLYGNNTFGGHKSYHVVGELHDFFGGYYHDDGYGFGHWARYEDMPGQKLWLWALSREGGVWEHLLTDTDGQYVEFQAGRLFVQYSPGSDLNPITQAGFDPLSASRWSERWFPVEGLGGLTEASARGAMYVEEEGGRLIVRVNAFRRGADTLWVWSGGAGDVGGEGPRTLRSDPVELEPLQPFETSVDLPSDGPFRVQLPGLGLDYSSDPSGRTLERSFATEPEARASIPEVDRMVFQARELLKGRRFPEARALFEAALESEPWNREALLGMADLSYRSGLYEDGLGHVNRALQLDAYDAEANFLAGILYRALARPADARDAFGWAARSVAFRAAAYTELAELMVMQESWAEATRYARMAIDSDRHNVRAWRALAIIGRKTGNEALAREARGELEAMDPLGHFVKGEEYLEEKDPESGGAFLSSLGGEYPEQSLLELGIGYANLGMAADALFVLEAGARLGMAENPVHGAWMAWLDRGPARLIGAGGPAFAFPYRTESLPVLRWAADHSDEWKWSYLYALNLWTVDRTEAAAAIFADLGETPDYGPFYAARASLAKQAGSVGSTAGSRAEAVASSAPMPDPEEDLRRAVELDPGERTLHVLLIRHLQDQGKWESALASLAEARARFPGDFNLALLQARSLINLGRPLEATEILGQIQVLPSEGGRESHSLWEQAHALAALDALEGRDYEEARTHAHAAMEWPESLGQGRPYEPEERLPRFLLGLAEARLGNVGASLEAFTAVVEASRLPNDEAEWTGPGTVLDLLTLQAMTALGRFDQVAALESRHRDRLEALREGLAATLDGRMIRRALDLGREE